MSVLRDKQADNESFFGRQLTEADAPAVARLCEREPLRLLSLRMNLDRYGYNSRVIRAWGVFRSGQSEPQGLLLRFSNTVVLADSEGECAPAFAELIDSQTGVAGVRGTIEAIRGLLPLLRRYKVSASEDSYFMRLAHPPACPPETLALARRATGEDRDMLTALYAGAGAMYRNRANVTTKLAESRVFVVEEPAISRRPARITACALLNVEGQEAGLIGGVYTLPEARGKGYAAACTGALARDLQIDGKLPCLFYENPIAGRVYRRLGFEIVDHWAVLYVKP